MREIDKKSIANIRVTSMDAVELLTDHIRQDQLSELRIYFPDPWPKMRHNKRRLLQSDFVSLAVSRLRPGGVLHAATDWAEYADQMLTVLEDEPRLINMYNGFAPERNGRPATRFEIKGIEKGHEIRDLLFSKVPIAS